MAGLPLVAALVFASPPAVEARVRASLGLEYDTNARRAVEGRRLDLAGLDEEVVSDALGRAFVDASATLRAGSTSHFGGGLTLGAKRFSREATEDLVALGARLGGAHRFSEAWTISSVASSRVSRIRDGSRDYDLGTASVGLVFAPGALDFGVSTQLVAFRFLPEDNYDHLGPGLGAEVGWRPWRPLRLAATFSRTWRFYQGNGLVVALPVVAGVGEKLTFCEDPQAERAAGRACQSRPRRDEDWQAGLRASYRGPVVASAGYTLRVQRSTSDLENVDRHRLFASAALGLPWQIDVGLEGSLQFNVGASVSRELQLSEADEDQNSLQLKILRPVHPQIDLELRYGLFWSEFGGESSATFLRQTAFLGLAVHTGR